jgi:hypothetical protein
MAMTESASTRERRPCCRVCRFTERSAYRWSCAWSEGDLCQRCADMAEALVRWAHKSRWRARAALWREVERLEREDLQIGFIPGKEKTMNHDELEEKLSKLQKDFAGMCALFAAQQQAIRAAGRRRRDAPTNARGRDRLSGTGSGKECSELIA